VGVVTAFFVPGLEPDESEARYVQLAAMVEAPAVGPADRVLSVRFVQGAEEWTATVGQSLSGELSGKADRRSARRSAATRRVTDPATVQAIFDTGDHYLVLTDVHPHGDVRDSTWDNPFSIPRRHTRGVLRFGG
jgi:hypothetical protein